MQTPEGQSTGDVGEGAVAVVLEQEVLAAALELPRVGRLGRFAGLGPAGENHAMARHEEVEVAVAIHVAPRCRARPTRHPGDARPRGDVGEVAGAVVFPEEVGVALTGKVEVEVAVAVHVGGCSAPGVAVGVGERDAVERFVCHLAVGLPHEQHARRVCG